MRWRPLCVQSGQLVARGQRSEADLPFLGRDPMAVAERLHCGAVAVNESFHIAWATMDAPLGGIGISGVGRRHGPEGLLRFTQAKAVARQRLKAVTAPVAGLTDEQFARVQTVLLRVVKASGRR